MSLLQAILLAVLQGVTEFLPVSSSGHLSFFQHFLKNLSSQDILAFNIFIHMGTLCSVVIYYQKDLSSLVGGIRSDFREYRLAARSSRKSGLNDKLKQFTYISFLFKLIITTVITAGIGLVLKNVVNYFYQDLFKLGLVYLVMVVILSSHKYINKNKSGERERGVGMFKLSLKMAIVVGIVQGMAVLPGISRSGITLTVVMLLGLQIKDQMKYVMIISVPVILGAFVAFELPDVVGMIQQGGEETTIYLVAFVVSLVVGILSLKLFSYFIVANKVHYFAYYLLVFSGVVFYYSDFVQSWLS